MVRPKANAAGDLFGRKCCLRETPLQSRRHRCWRI